MTKEELRALKVAKTHFFMSTFIRKMNPAHSKEVSALHRAISEVERIRVNRVKILSKLPGAHNNESSDVSSAFRSKDCSYVASPTQGSTALVLKPRAQSGITSRTRAPVLQKYTWVQRSVIVFAHLHHLLGNANFEHTETLTGVIRSKKALIASYIPCNASRLYSDA
jgi:hypothetical protein